MLVEGNAIKPRAAGSEALKVALAGTSPIPELRAELEGGARGWHPVPRIERQQAAELLERRQSAHGLIAAGRIRRFDQQDFGAIARQRPRQHRGGHPPGETATDHQYTSRTRLV